MGVVEYRWGVVAVLRLQVYIMSRHRRYYIVVEKLAWLGKLVFCATVMCLW